MNATAVQSLQCWSISEVAARLGVNVRTVNRLIASGELAVLPIRGRTVVTEQALIDYQRFNEVRRTPRKRTS
jgi:excisionase family DNA binding protein